MSDGFLQPYLDSTFGHWLYIDSAMWTAVGFLGAAIFGSRFVLQWLQSEKEKKLVVPWYFWHLSFWGSVLNLLYFLHIDKAPLILGNCFLPFLYGRNIIFLRQTQDRRRGGGRMVMAGVVVLMLATFGYTALTSPDAKLRQDLQALKDMESIVQGVKGYYAEHHQLPKGSTSEMVRELIKDNPRHIAYINVPKDRLDKEGAWLDPWGQPYRIFVSGNQVIIRSAGKNGQFDDGLDDKRDDILVQGAVN